MDPNKSDGVVKSPVELIPKLIAAVYSRALSWAYARTVQAKVKTVSIDELPAVVEAMGQGLSLVMRAGERLMLQWIIPGSTWTSLLSLWERVKKTQAAALAKPLMRLMISPLELMAFLSREEGGAELESGWERESFVPLLSNWDMSNRDTIRWAAEDSQVFEVAAGKFSFLVFWESRNLRHFAAQLAGNAGFRTLVNEQALGRYSGKDGAERAWYSFPTAKIALGDDFPFGALLLPSLRVSTDTTALPVFGSAETGSFGLPQGALILQRKFVFEGQTVQILYADESETKPGGQPGLGSQLKPDTRGSWLELLSSVLTGSGLYPAIFGSGTQEIVTKARSSGSALPEMVRVSAFYNIDGENAGKGIAVYLPRGFLNVIATRGNFAWDWRPFMDGVGSQLSLLFSLNEKIRMLPPPDLTAFAGGAWSYMYFRQSPVTTAEYSESTPAHGLLVAELLSVSPHEDRIRIVQNCIIPEYGNESSLPLFYYSRPDYPNSDSSASQQDHVLRFRLPSFDENAYLELLPKRQRDDWNRALPSASFGDLMNANTRIMRAIYRAHSKGDLQLGYRPARLIEELFAKHWRDTRQKQAIAAVGSGFSQQISALSKTARKGSALIALGPRVCAQALALDPDAAALVKRPLVSSGFEKEFRELLAIAIANLEKSAEGYDEIIVAVGGLREAIGRELAGGE